MDYVKFEKAKELKLKIEILQRDKEHLNSLYKSSSAAEGFRKNLCSKDYEAVVAFAISLVNKRLDEAEDQFRLL